MMLTADYGAIRVDCRRCVCQRTNIPYSCCTSAETYTSEPGLKHCKPPEKIHGQDLEIAIRKIPYKGYPPKYGIAPPPKPRKKPNPKELKKIEEDNLLLKQPVKELEWTSRFCLRRIHALLVREQTQNMGPRILSLWNEYEKRANDVFIYEEIDVVANIVLILSTSFIRLNYAPDLFDKVMQRLQRGVYIKTPGELMKMDVRRLAYCLTVLGVSIVEGHPYAQKSISSILRVWIENMLSTKDKNTSAKNLRCSSLPCNLMKGSNQLRVMIPNIFLLAALEKTLLPRIIALYIKDGLHTDGYISILSLLGLCCDASAIISERLWCLSILDPVLLKLCILDPSNRTMMRTIDFIYSYLGGNGIIHSEKLTTVPNLEKEPFQVLLTRFLQQLRSCTSKSLLSTRNDTAFSICLIVNRIPVAGRYFQGYGSLIASIISNGILYVKEDEPTYMQIDSTPEDLELLQYLVYILKSIIEAGCGEEIVTDYNIVSVLLILLLGPCKLNKKTREEKGNDLDNSAWSTLNAIAKYLPLSMLTPHGVSSLLAFLKSYGMRGEGDKNILTLSMHTLRLLLTVEDTAISDEVLTYFVNYDAMSIFLGVLKQMIKENFDVLQEETVVINVLYCCAALGFFDLKQKEMFTSLEGVSILTRLMRHLLRQSVEQRHVDPVIQIALAECIWGCLANYPRGLETFLDNEGLFRLLDVLEVSEGPTAPVHIISCVLQLCEYPRCINQLMFWQRPMKNAIRRVVFGEEVGSLARSVFSGVDKPQTGDILKDLAGPFDQNLASLLCDLWKDEEIRFGVFRDPDGCISSLTQPLMSKFAREYDDGGQTGIFKSCLDMSLSLRPKVFLLIRRIVEITKTEATLFDNLSLPNQTVMQVIINFFDLKNSEMYLEMADDIQKQEMSFIPGDDTAASKLFAISKNKIATVVETQRYLIRRYREREETTEYEFYALLKLCRLQDHLVAAKEIDYLARTTNYQYLVEKRLWQKCELERAAKDLDISSFSKNSRIHRTSDFPLNTTTWSSLSRAVDSEPAINKEGIPDTYEDNEIEEGQEEKEDLEGTPSDATITQAEQQGSILHVTAVTQGTEDMTPEALEGGFYQVSPHLLRDALEKLLADRKRHDWDTLMNDDDNAWKIRTKWKREWYPADKE